MRLIDALRVESSSRISLVGSGGKTSAILCLGKEWGKQSILAATAHFGVDKTGFVGRHLIWEPSTPPDIASIRLDQTTILTGPQRDEFILFGVDPSQWEFIKRLADIHHVPVFLESDGSKTRPLKAPAAHEPPIPDWVNHVVVSVGLSVLGQNLNDQSVHRPEVFALLTGLEKTQPVTIDSIITMLKHPEGGLKNIPTGARKTVLFNQVDTVMDLSILQEFEESLLETYDSVVFASLLNATNQYRADEQPDGVIKTVEKTAGIILAAGNSKRMGKPKALLNWGGIPFVRACVLQAIAAGLNPIHIVAGNEYDVILNAVSDLPVVVVKNHEWQTGQSSSIRAGIKSFTEKVGSAIFLLVDQPQIPQTLIRQLVTEHSLTQASIVLPESGGRRANPVLFDRVTFPDLLKLQGDVGGRSIFSHYPIKAIPWNDEIILLDVDTPEDYDRLVSY